MGIAITNGCTNMLLYRQCSHCRQSMPKPTACVSSCSNFGTVPCGVSINSNLCTLLLKNRLLSDWVLLLCMGICYVFETSKLWDHLGPFEGSHSRPPSLYYK